MRRPLLIYVLLLFSALAWPASAEAGWCKRQLWRFSFAVQERLQNLEPRESAKYLEEIEGRTVRLDLPIGGILLHPPVDLRWSSFDFLLIWSWQSFGK
jgi:hypothetical protein